MWSLLFASLLESEPMEKTGFFLSYVVCTCECVQQKEVVGVLQHLSISRYRFTLHDV